MRSRINQRWIVGILIVSIIFALGGMFVSAVQKIRTAATRTSDL